jgi:hypothetical protein
MTGEIYGLLVRKPRFLMAVHTGDLAGVAGADRTASVADVEGGRAHAERSRGAPWE